MGRNQDNVQGLGKRKTITTQLEVFWPAGGLLVLYRCLPPTTEHFNLLLGLPINKNYTKHLTGEDD
jgi:hypothetical protein